MADDGEKIVGIVRGLLEKTGSGLVKWKEGGEDEFFATVGTGSVTIGYEGEVGLFGALVARHLVVKVLNKRGSLIASARGDTSIGPLERKDWEPLLSQLFTVARRQALQVDAVLDNVLDDIEAIGSNEELP